MAAGGGLKDFIFRAEVLKLYRQFVRVARQAPGQAAEELKAQIRHEFEAQRGVSDTHHKKYLLSDGRNRLKMLSEMLGMQR